MEIPSVEIEMPGLHYGILFIILPDAAAEERWRNEIYNTIRSLDDLKEELGKWVCNLKQTTLR